MTAREITVIHLRQPTSCLPLFSLCWISTLVPTAPPPHLAVSLYLERFHHRSPVRWQSPPITAKITWNTNPDDHQHRSCKCHSTVQSFDKRPVRHEAGHLRITTGVLWDMWLGLCAVAVIKGAGGGGLIAALSSPTELPLSVWVSR